VHVDARGQANRWAERTTKGVYGPLFFGAEICAWFLAMALGWLVRLTRSRSRSVMLGGMIAVEYLVGLLNASFPSNRCLEFPFGRIALSADWSSWFHSSS